MFITFISVPTYVLLPMCSFLCAPTYVLLPMCSYLCASTYVLLPMFRTYIFVPTYVLLPMFLTYIFVPTYGHHVAKAVSDQCNQKARLFTQYLASFKRENLPNCIKNQIRIRSLPNTK